MDTQNQKISLANLSEKSAQEIFNYVVENLRKQGRPSFHYGKCYYRLETGEGVLRCAAGFLISDEEYKKEFEDNCWLSIKFKNDIKCNYDKLVSDLQSLHDKCAEFCTSDTFMVELEKGFKKIAKDYSLVYS